MKRLFLALLLCAGCAAHKQDIRPPFYPVGVIVTPTPDATFDTGVEIALTQTEKSVETVEARETAIPLPPAQEVKPNKPNWYKLLYALILAVVPLWALFFRNPKPKKRKGGKK